MEAFFDDAPSGGHSCASVVELQQHLQHQIHTKVTPTKAEHISTTFELRSNVVFAILVTENENASLEVGAGIDPRLAGAQSVPVGGEQTIRHFNAIDTVLNQSQTDNLVQRIVSKHIMSVIGEADQSQWMLRSMARGTQGWTFIYNCKDSWQMWGKEKSRHLPKTAVGEWSNKDGQDPINLARPAFDCRGSLTISFSKSDKAISVKYDHTVMHQTVEQLMNLLAPAPPPQPSRAEARGTAPKKTPRKRISQAAVDFTGEGGRNEAAADRVERATLRTTKKRKKTAAAPDNEGGAAGSVSTKRAKKRKTNDVDIDPALSMLAPPEMPGALPVGDASRRPLYNTQPSQGGELNPAYPEPLVGAAAANSVQDAASAMVSSSVHQHSILNLPPGEAERRRELAIRLLTEWGIDPQTLGAEQFSILANQSPKLQKESLQMLVKYGAERLKIILPDKDANAAAAAPSATAPTADQNPNGQSADTAGQQDQVEGTPTRKGGRKKMPTLKAKNADTSLDMGDDDTPAKPATAKHTGSSSLRPKKPKLSRGSCTPCREAKLKCDKSKPSCDKCMESGNDCSYPLEKSMKSKASLKPESQGSTEPEQEQPRATEKTPEPQPQPAAAVGEDDPDGLPSPGFSAYYSTARNNTNNQNGDQSAAQEPYESGADVSQYQDAAEVPQPQIEHQQEQESTTLEDSNHQSTYSDSNSGVYRDSSNLTFPQTITPEVTQQVWTDTNPTSGYHQGSTQQAAPANVAFSEQTTGPTATRASATRTASYDHNKSWGSVAASQRTEIPTSTSTAADNLVNILSGNPWGNTYDTEPQAPTSNVRASPNQSRRAAKPADLTAYHDDMRSVSALAQAAMNASKSASPVVQQATAYETPAAASRAKSRQGHRPQAQGQTRTPVPNQPSVPRQQQRSAVSITPTPATSYPVTSEKSRTSYKTPSSYYSTNRDQSSNRVACQPDYQQNTARTASTTYQDFDYNARPSQSSNSTVSLSKNAAQAANSYTSNTPSTTTQWAGNTPGQTRSSLPYSTTSSTPASAALNMRPSANQAIQRSHVMQNFNVRPQQPAQPQSRSTAAPSAYGQQSQAGYSYPTQPHQQQPTANNPNQHGWYTGNAAPTAYGTAGGRGGGAAGASANYSGAAAGSHGGPHYTQQQQQQHGTQPQHAHHANNAMSLSGHTYSSMDQFNILPGGSGH